MDGRRKGWLQSLASQRPRLTDGLILVQHGGKGGKFRRIGMARVLQDQIAWWIAVRPKSERPELLLTINGHPITGSTVNDRIRRLSEKTGVKFTAHGLRRSFVTINASKGMPLPLLQNQTGHADVQTLQGYVMDVEAAALDWMRGG